MFSMKILVANLRDSPPSPFSSSNLKFRSFFNLLAELSVIGGRQGLSRKGSSFPSALTYTLKPYSVSRRYAIIIRVHSDHLTLDVSIFPAGYSVLSNSWAAGAIA